MSPDINAAASALQEKLLWISSGQTCSGRELGKMEDKLWWSCQVRPLRRTRAGKELKLSCLPECCFLYQSCHQNEYLFKLLNVGVSPLTSPCWALHPSDWSQRVDSLYLIKEAQDALRPRAVADSRLTSPQKIALSIWYCLVEGNTMSPGVSTQGHNMNSILNKSLKQVLASEETYGVLCQQLSKRHWNRLC